MTQNYNDHGAYVRKFHDENGDSKDSTILYTNETDDKEFENYANLISDLSSSDVYTFKKDKTKSDDEINEYINSLFELNPNSIILIQDTEMTDSEIEEENSNNNSYLWLLLLLLLRRKNASIDDDNNTTPEDQDDVNDDVPIGDPFSLYSEINNSIELNSPIYEMMNETDLSYSATIEVFSTKYGEYLDAFSVEIDGITFNTVNNSEMFISDIPYGEHEIVVTADNHKTDTFSNYFKGFNGKNFNFSISLDQSTVYIYLSDDKYLSTYHRYNDFEIIDAVTKNQSLIDAHINPAISSLTDDFNVIQYANLSLGPIDELNNSQIQPNISILFDSATEVTIP